VEYILQPDRTHCTDMWDILYSQTGHCELICGIYCIARQDTVGWYVEYIVQPDRTQWADMWNILYSQTGTVC